MKFIDNLNKNIRTLSIQEWKSLLTSEMAFIFSTKTYNLNPNYLYRARTNYDDNKVPIDFFIHVEDLWAPPDKCINRDGRCNIKGQSTLYCATSPTTTLFEIKPDTGEELTIIDYSVLRKIENLGIVGCKEISLLGDDYKAIFGQHLNGSTRETETLDDTLSAIFKSNHTVEYPIYNLTNAIYQIFTVDSRNDLVPDFLKLPKFNGLIYPSIATNKLLGINIAMDPAAAKEILKPYTAYKYKVKYKIDDHHYLMTRTHMTKNIDTSGVLTWEQLYRPIEECITDLPLSNNNMSCK